jgi:hypothetical protein
MSDAPSIALRRSIEQWRAAVLGYIDAIGEWRNARPGERLRTYWADAQLSPNLGDVTQHLVSTIMRQSPKLDPQPLLDLHTWIAAWYGDRCADRIPPQDEVIERMERAFTAVGVIDERAKAESQQEIGGEMELLCSLRKRDTWRLYELPPGITEPLVRRWDASGYVEIHLWETAERRPLPYENPRREVVRRCKHTGWHSPANSPGYSGWDRELEMCPWYSLKSPELRLTKTGHQFIDQWRLMHPGNQHRQVKNPAPKKKKPKRRGQREKSLVLTAKQKEAWELVEEHGVREAARLLGKRESGVHELHRKAQEKIDLMSKSKSVRPTQQLPHDRRGNPDVAS